jgi:polyisoprenoid-binding protein YceI
VTPRLSPRALGAALGLLAASGAAVIAAAPKIATASAPTRAEARVGAEPRASTAQAQGVRYATDGPGNLARYRVRERLLNNELDNDAVGETNAIRGSIALDASSRIVPAGSLFTVELAGLKSDKSRRDTYVRNRLLETAKFPSTRFAITSVRGLPSPLPTSGRVQFQLLGDLTVKGVTRPTTWTVDATVAGDRLTGKAATSFTFAQFQLTQPKVSVVLSVNDTIRLEYDFAMKKQP